MTYYARSGSDRRNGDRRQAYANYANYGSYANYAQYSGPERRMSDRRSGQDRRQSY